MLLKCISASSREALVGLAGAALILRPGAGLRESLPHEGMMGTASSALADTLDRSGRYLEEEGLRGMADDLTNLIRRFPGGASSFI